jgi:outer membrane immunogenic protein
MKYLLLAGASWAVLSSGSAMAADIAVKAPAYKSPPVAAFSWTGCFIGGNVGALSARKEWINRDPALDVMGTSFGTHEADSWLGGVQGGCDYQIGQWVVGAQGDYDWTDDKGENKNLRILALGNRSRISSLASVTARLGMTFDRLLLYARGGAAWERDQYDYYSPLTTLTIASATETRSGWTLGAGGEYALTGLISLFGEYDYYDFGTRAITFISTANGATFTTTDIKDTKHVLKAGLNFRWGGGPIIARY